MNHSRRGITYAQSETPVMREDVILGPFLESRRHFAEVLQMGCGINCTGLEDVKSKAVFAAVSYVRRSIALMHPNREWETILALMYLCPLRRPLIARINYFE